MTKKVPTNIITGFLGVGKTTTILNLLKHKPADEKWAVLVNEFGEIGIDGAMMSEQGAFIKE
ncbi:CobW-like GTP-binding protein, partial [Vibrio fujianensis]